MSTTLINLLTYLYPLPEPNRTRDRPLQVIGVGPSRSGTDSLRQALIQLGYKEVSHGYHIIDNNIGEIPQWMRLILAKYYNKTSFLNAAEFDKVLGNCEAGSDSHMAYFGAELIRAYPDAKVVLNYRDVEKWHASAAATMEPRYQATFYSYLQFFDAREFWTTKLLQCIWYAMWGGKFAEEGKEKYLRHFEEMEALCVKLGRPYVKWKVQDGWEPLCELLGKDVPKEEFPSGNAPQEFLEKVNGFHQQWRRNGRKNFAFFCVLLVSPAMAGLARFFRVI